MRYPHAVCKIPAAPGPMRLASVALAMGRAERRQAAILVADVAEYSRLIGADEGVTRERLARVLREVVDPKLKECHGRIVKSTGDGLLWNLPVSSMRCSARPKSRAPRG